MLDRYRTDGSFWIIVKVFIIVEIVAAQVPMRKCAFACTYETWPEGAAERRAKVGVSLIPCQEVQKQPSKPVCDPKRVT